MDGNQVVAPENNWVRDMEKEWAATGYDDRFFDDDWDDVKPGPKPPAKEKFPFKNISDEDWKETVTWEDEEADGTISRSDAAKARADRAARTDPSSPSFTPPPDDPRVDPGPDFTPPVMDLNYDEEAAMLGFDAKAGDGGAEGDEAEPEGPPAVMLAGFRAEEIPRVRELLDELGGHDVPVTAVPQDYLTRPLYAALQIPEPDWESPRAHDSFNQGGEFGSQRCVIFSGLDRGEMATVVSAIESRGLPRLIAVVVTSSNLEQSLGEALAIAVKESREENRERESFRRKDYVAELKKLERTASTEGLTVEQMVRREIERQDQLERDEAARETARDENVERAESHMRALKDEYVKRERAKYEAEAVAGKNSPDDELDTSDWPTIEDTVPEGFGIDEDGIDVDIDGLGVDLGLDPEKLREAVVDAAKDAIGQTETHKTAVETKRHERSVDALAGAAEGGADGADTAVRDETDMVDEAIKSAITFEDELEDGEYDDGCYEVDPMKWSERTDASYGAPVVTSTPPPTPAAAPVNAIEEPASAEANPRARQGVKEVVNEVAPEVAAEEASSGVETVEGQVMTKKMLRDLAARRGLSYTDMLNQARASGIDLPDE